MSLHVGLARVLVMVVVQSAMSAHVLVQTSASMQLTHDGQQWQPAPPTGPKEQLHVLLTGAGSRRLAQRVSTNTKAGNKVGARPPRFLLD